MSERDARVEAMLAAWPRHSFIADGQAPDEIGPAQTARREALLRSLLAAADAVQGEDEGPRYLSLDDVSGWRGGGVMSRHRDRQPADGKRMVDLNAVIEALDDVASKVLPGSDPMACVRAAAGVIERKFGGPAPTEEGKR